MINKNLKIERLLKKFNFANSYSKQRKALTSILKLGAVLNFNYEKLDREIKSVQVAFNPDYTYNLPPKDSDFIYLFDIQAGIFKHYKLKRIFDISFSEGLGF